MGRRESQRSPAVLRGFETGPHNFRTSVMRMASGDLSCELCGMAKGAMVHYGS